MNVLVYLHCSDGLIVTVSLRLALLEIYTFALSVPCSSVRVNVITAWAWSDSRASGTTSVRRNKRRTLLLPSHEYEKGTYSSA